MNPCGQTVCLTMIVRDEAPVIRRCLASLRPLIDRWLIVDTGSRDGTQDLIRAHLRDVPGTLVERPWVNFAHNRSEALALARGGADYLLLIDADETLEVAPGFTLPRLTADAYSVLVSAGGVSYPRIQWVSGGRAWRYEGVLHEYLTSDGTFTRAPLAGVRTLAHPDGARARDPQTFRRDAQTLEAALRAEPDNARYVFYLAQSYQNAGDLSAALAAYQRRAAMGGWREEVWNALYQAARLREQLGHDWEAVQRDYLSAAAYDPARAEPLYRLGAHFLTAGNPAVARAYLARALDVPRPPHGALFVEDAVYDYLTLADYAAACFDLAQYAEALQAYERLLHEGRLPAAAAATIRANRRVCLLALDDGAADAPPTPDSAR